MIPKPKLQQELLEANEQFVFVAKEVKKKQFKNA